MSTQLGRYEILRPIASGGMATVHLGRVVGEGGFERLLAIKVMHPHLLQDGDFVAMFLDEARLAARIRHPNVVSTIDVQRTPEALFLVMEYIEGPTLQRLIKVLRKKGEHMPLSIVLRIALDVLSGLDEAHELVGADDVVMNIVHRDVSPSNVLVGKDGITLITDFGVARAEARISSTRGGELKGKFPYMAPEQLGRGPIDRRVDVYAAGVVLWEMLTLERLFRGEDNAQTLALVLAGPRRSPSEVRHDIPWSVDRAVMRALEAVDDRFRTAAAFADALEQAAAHDGIPIAKAREVAALVREHFPMSTSPTSDPGGLHTPLGLLTPSTGSAEYHVHRSSAPSPASGPPQPPDRVAPRDATERLAYSDAVPTTHASVVAPPSHSRRAARPSTLSTLLVALGASIVGGVVVWLAVQSSNKDVAPGAGLAGTATSTSVSRLDASAMSQDPGVVPKPPPKEPGPAAPAKATASRHTVPRPPTSAAPKPKPSPTPRPQPPPSSTAFRPNLP